MATRIERKQRNTSVESRVARTTVEARAMRKTRIEKEGAVATSLHRCAHTRAVLGSAPSTLVLKASQRMTKVAAAAVIRLAPTAPPTASTDLTYPAAATVNGHRAVRLDNGAVRHASVFDAFPWAPLGVALNAALTGQPVDVRTGGAVAFSGWNWLPQRPVFLGTNGELTQTPLQAGFLISIGFALSATELFVRIGRPILRSS